MIRVQILQPFSSLGIVLRKDDNKFKEEAEAWSSFERFEKANEWIFVYQNYKTIVTELSWQ